MKFAAWLLLTLLLAATLVGAATFDRRTWPSVVGDEATYLMAAQSLAWDHDLRYDRADYGRFVATWGARPEGLILQSADGGRTLVYGKPAAYPLFLAPFVRLLPHQGPWVANAVLLALAAVVAARALQRRIGDAAPLWVACWIFASVPFAYAFWAHADLFLMCLVAIALALVYGVPGDARGPVPRSEAARPAGEARERPGAGEADATAAAAREGLPPAALRRWAAAGALLGITVVSRPLYLPLLLPAVLAAPRGLRLRAGTALATGALAVALVSAGASLAARGTWTSYAGERQSFYSYTGFPRVGSVDWKQQLAGQGTSSWVKAQTLEMGLDARQTAWNAVYYLVGRHVGVLPYFLPLLLGLVALRVDEGRWALPLAALAAALVLFWVRPFNFYGGGGAIANRYFLPVYPALWFLAGRPPRGWRAIAAPLGVAALAAPFLWPLWAAPRAFPVAADGGYRWVGAAAGAVLPYETTLSHLKPSGEEDFQENGLWVKLLTPGLAPVRGGAAVRIAAGTPKELLIGSPQPLAAVRVLLSPGERLSVDGATPAAEPSEIGWRLAFRHPRAVHRMWWSDAPFYLYALRLVPAVAGRDVTFRLLPEASAAMVPAPVTPRPTRPQAALPAAPQLDRTQTAPGDDDRRAPAGLANPRAEAASGGT